MANERLEILAGAAVLAAAMAFVLYAGQGGGMGGGETYPLKASFRSVEGIAVGADVRLGGVKVGAITSLDLNPTTFFADANIAVDQRFQVPDDSAILISSEGLLGGNFVEIVPGGSVTNFAPGDEIEDTQGAVSLVSIMMKFVGGSSSTPAPAP